jgi:SOS-response transcriptional repressor LexA
MTVRVHKDTTEVVFEFITAYIGQHDFPPSVRDIAQGCQIGLASVAWHVGKLEAQGRVRRTSRVARGLSLVKSNEKNRTYGLTPPAHSSYNADVARDYSASMWITSQGR